MDQTTPTRTAASSSIVYDRRREPRLPRVVPIGVSGFDSSGQFFTERTSTVDVSSGGCKFGLNVGLGKDSVIAIRVIRLENWMEINSPPVLFRLAWVQETEQGFVLGAEQLQRDRPWSVHLPQ
jgi:hypothetical protein